MAKDKQLYQRQGVWWCRIRVEGKTKRMTTGCRDYEAAVLRKKELERRAADPVLHAASKAEFEPAANRLLSKLVQAGKAAGTLQMYRYKAGHLLRVFGNCKLVEINAAKVEGYVSQRLKEGAATHSLQKELTALRRILKLAKHVGEFAADVKALMPFDFNPEYKPRVRFLADYEELQRLILELPRERAAHVCFILATGARWSESVKAERKDINLEAGIILLRGTKTRASWRMVPILDIFKPALAVVLEVVPETHSGRMFPPWTAAGHGIPNACQRARIAKLSPNDLRRTAASWLRQAGVEPSLIAPFLGHVDGRMVERVYGRLPVQSLADAIGRRLGSESAVKQPVKRQDQASEHCAQFVPAEPLKIGTRTVSAARSAAVTERKSKRFRVSNGDRTRDNWNHNPDASNDQFPGNNAGNDPDKRATVSDLCTVKPVKPRTKKRS